MHITINSILPTDPSCSERKEEKQLKKATYYQELLFRRTVTVHEKNASTPTIHQRVHKTQRGGEREYRSSEPTSEIDHRSQTNNQNNLPLAKKKQMKRYQNQTLNPDTKDDFMAQPKPKNPEIFEEPT